MEKEKEKDKDKEKEKEKGGKEIRPIKTKFTDGEKVLCFHGPLIYEAKCLKVQVKDKQVKYFIHYAGWNKNWDEWVPESRVLKLNDANINRQKDLQKAHEASLKNKKSKKNLVDKKKVKEGGSPAQTGQVVVQASDQLLPLPQPQHLSREMSQNLGRSARGSSPLLILMDQHKAERMC